MYDNKWCAEYRNKLVFFPGGVFPTNEVPINMLASAEIDVLEKNPVTKVKIFFLGDGI